MLLFAFTASLQAQELPQQSLGGQEVQRFPTGGGSRLSEDGLPVYTVVVFKGGAPLLDVNEAGNAVGYYVDVLRVMGQELALEFEFVSTDWATRLQAVREGQIDLIVAVYSDERREYLDFLNSPLYTAWSIVKLHRDSAIKGIADLEDKIVGLVSGDQNSVELRKLLDSLGIHPQYRNFPGPQELETALAVGSVEAGAFFRNYEVDDVRIKSSSIVYSPNQSSVATGRGRNAALLARMDALLTRWMQFENNPLEELEAKYFDRQREVERLPEWLAPLLSVLIFSAIVGIFFAILFRILVSRRTLQLVQARTSAEAVFNFSPTPMILLDAGDLILEVNQAFLQLLEGGGAAKLRGIPLERWIEQRFIDKQARHATLTQWNFRRQAVTLPEEDSNSLLDIEAEIRGHSAANLRLHIRAEFLPELQRSIVAFNDLTELRENQNQLEEINRDLERMVEIRSSALEESREALMRSEKVAGLGRMLAGLAHEVNTPIGVALTASTFLNDEIKKFIAIPEGQITKSGLSRLLDEALRASQLVSDNLERASNLVSDFKQVSADNSMANPLPREIELSEYITRLIDSLSPRFSQTKHRCLVSVPHLQVTTIPGVIGQILTNLVDNSLKYGFEENVTGTIRISAKQNAELVELSFEDNGRGVPEAHLSRLFEPFFTTGRTQGGTGLGLSIVHTLVTEKLHGEIRALHGKKGGLSFQISFPLKHPLS